MSQKIQVFICSTPEDQMLCKKLLNHLSTLKEKYIDIWCNLDITPGSHREQIINEHINTADLILLLISSNFLASEYYYSKAKQTLVKATRVILIILSPVNWRDTPFSDLQALPEGAKPVTQWSNRDKAFTDIVETIRLKIKTLQNHPHQHEPLQSEQPQPTPRGKLLRVYDVHASFVVAVSWEPGGARIASAGGDGTIRIWDTETGTSLLTYHNHTHWLSKANLPPTIYTVAWSPRGGRIVSAGSGKDIHVWDAATGQTLRRYQDHHWSTSYIFTTAWSPDGSSIASAGLSWLKTKKAIHIWNASTGQPLAYYDAHASLTKSTVLSLAWSPDGTRLAAVCPDDTIRIWNTITHNLIATYPSHPAHLSWSPDSRYLASAYSNHQARIWDTYTGTTITTYSAHTDRVRHIAWSPDGTTVASASNDTTVHLWDPFTGTRHYIYRGHSGSTTSLAWSPDGTRIASASTDKTVHLWQATNPP